MRDYNTANCIHKNMTKRHRCQLVPLEALKFEIEMSKQRKTTARRKQEQFDEEAALELKA